MDARFDHKDKTLTVSLAGDLTGGADAMSFSKDLKSALQSAGPIAVIEIDASAVGFVNSSGLGMLLGARQAAVDSGAELKIKNSKEQLRSLLDLTKLTTVLGAS